MSGYATGAFFGHIGVAIALGMASKSKYKFNMF
jgi:hypothetical protein